MSISFPFTYVACPCSEEIENPALSIHARRVSQRPLRTEVDDEEDDSEPIDPHHPRSDFNLYPYDQLLFCDECQQIRCPRCWTEETTNWYCPNCLFEVASSTVRSDGNRCGRQCYNCPACTSPLVLASLNSQSSDASAPEGPFFLSCQACPWSSLDAGLQFPSHRRIPEQLSRMRAGKPPVPETDVLEKEQSTYEPDHEPVESTFARLLNFYDTQLTESDASTINPFGIDSPSALHHIMHRFSGLSPALQQARRKPRPMREAINENEGLHVLSSTDDDATISRLCSSSASELTTSAQRASHPWNAHARFISDLWPVPALLRSRKSKRCRTCRLILIRYDDRKSGSTGTSSSHGTSLKYKIRLLAQNNIPRLALRPFTTCSSTPANPAFALTTTALTTLQNETQSTFTLPRGRTRQFLLHVTNPLFETTTITLATPGTVPGPIPANVTILCPTFALGPDGDIWDAALDGAKAKPANLAGGPGQTAEPAEAGKVWSRGRNWAGVVLEVSVPLGQTEVPSQPFQEDEDYDEYVARLRKERNAKTLRNEQLEIPVLVRAEWEADTEAGREKRDVQFWCVLGGITIS